MTTTGPRIWPTSRRTGRFATSPTRSATARGRQRLLQISGKPVFGPNRRFLGYRGTGRDITAEGEANRRLRESENRFRSLVENLRGIIFCRGVAGNGPYGYDEHGVQVFGPDAQHLTPISATAAWYAIVHPDDLPGYLEAERRRKEQSNPYSLEYRVDPTGSGEERWMQEVAWVTEAPAEQKRYLDSYVIDITDRKRTEIQLAEQGRENATYRAMIAALPDVDLRQGSGGPLHCRQHADRYAGGRRLGGSAHRQERLRLSSARGGARLSR